MASIIQLRKLKEKEERKLAKEREKIKLYRKVKAREEDLKEDIMKMRTERLRDKAERQRKARTEIKRLKRESLKLGKKVGKGILRYLQHVRDN